MEKCHHFSCLKRKQIFLDPLRVAYPIPLLPFTAKLLRYLHGPSPHLCSHSHFHFRVPLASIETAVVEVMEDPPVGKPGGQVSVLILPHLSSSAFRELKPQSSLHIPGFSFLLFFVGSSMSSKLLTLECPRAWF